MEFVLYIKNLIGITSNEPFVIYALCVLILSVIAISCFINILIYVFVNYFLSVNDNILKIINRYKFVNRIINIYKKTSMFFVTVEFVSLILCMGIIIQTSLKIVYNVS